MIFTPEQDNDQLPLLEAKSNKEWEQYYNEARVLVDQLREKLGVNEAYQILMRIRQEMLDLGYTEEQLRRCVIYHVLIGSTVDFNYAPYLDVAGEKMMKLLREAVRRISESS